MLGESGSVLDVGLDGLRSIMPNHHHSEFMPGQLERAAMQEKTND